MDVVKKGMALFLFAVSFIACDQKQSTPAGGQFIKTGQAGCETQHRSGEYLVLWQNGQVTIEHGTHDEAFTQEFLARHATDIVRAEPHYQMKTEAQVGQQDWGGEVNWGPYAVGADWTWGKGGTPVEILVAVIDSGLDTTHPELDGVLAENSAEEINGVDDDGNGYVDDRYGYDFLNNTGEITDSTGHGTHVSGVIAARHDRGQILGAAPGVKLLPLGFIGRSGGGKVVDAIRALRYAADRGARVINASWGGEACSLILRDEIAALADRNVLFVTAAGNSGNDLSRRPEYPAAFLLDNQITVGASTFDEKTAGFSNYGVEVDLMAPGAQIASTYPYALDLDGTEDGVVVLNGTSMAAPMVSAAAAILWSHKPDASYVEIKAALVEGVKAGPYPIMSRGQLDIPRALSLLLETGDNTPLN